MDSTCQLTSPRTRLQLGPLRHIASAYVALSCVAHVCGGRVMRTEPHILFADDNGDICELVQTLLHAAGFRVTTSDNAADVLQRVATESFDALILDYWMQEATGIELCRQIRTFDQTTPILICSGTFTQADREAGVQAGAQGYIVKPFNSAELIGALRSVLKASAADSAFTNG